MKLMCYNKQIGGVEPFVVSNVYKALNSQMTIAHNWNKICEVTVNKGNYLAIAQIGINEIANCKIPYARISHGSNIDQVYLNTPYGTETLIGIINVEEDNTPLDYWIYDVTGSNWTLLENYAQLQLIKLSDSGVKEGVVD